jgi:coenzyme F420-dependent glucose-6-phosphate dehydrogenase
MTKIGYTLSAEEHSPSQLVANAKRAEEVGFDFCSVSDHFHPWVPQQPESPLVWNVIGGVATVTERIELGTGVVCPSFRYHPAIVAQGAATSGAMMPGRFYLGLGTGENLNEHIIGQGWPAYAQRREMFVEALEIIQLLFEGGEQSYYGQFYTLENAKLYTLPDQLPPIYIAAAGPESATLAGEMGEGLINTSPDEEVVKAFQEAGGQGKPIIGQMTVCWAEDEQEAIKTALHRWPNAGMPGELSQELPTPAHFSQVSQLVTEEIIAESVVCGPDPEKHRAKVQEYVDAGFTHVYIHQVGDDQEGFFDFAKREILPKFQS